MTQDLTNALLAVMSLLASVAGVLFWRMLTRMEEKIDQWWKEHLECRQHQLEMFVRRDEFNEWKQSRRDLWDRLNKHAHAPNGSVILRKGD